MLSYKEYKLLNESLYGAFNLGIRSHGVVGGIVSDSPLNGTEAAIEAESEEALEEAKKGKKMKKKMDGEVSSEDEDVKKVLDAEEDHEDKDSEDEEGSEDHEDSEDEEGSEDHEDSEDHEEKASDKKALFMKKHMKKKSKKEWSEVVSDLETVLEEVSDEEALAEIKKGLEIIKEGMKKGHEKKHMKNHKPDDKKDDKKCGKYMNESEKAWWDSVNSMINTDAVQKNWDGGWSQVGEVQQAIRENEGLELDNNIKADDAPNYVRQGDTWMTIAKRLYGDNRFYDALHAANWKPGSKDELKPGMMLLAPSVEELKRRFPREIERAFSDS